MLNSIKSEANLLKAAGRSQDEILAFLAKSKISISDAIVIIRHLYGIGLSTAKVIVSSNSHWLQLQSENEILHDTLVEIFEDHQSKDKRTTP